MGRQRDWRELNMEFKSKRIEFQVIYEDEWRNRINWVFDEGAGGSHKVAKLGGEVGV